MSKEVKVTTSSCHEIDYIVEAENAEDAKQKVLDGEEKSKSDIRFSNYFKVHDIEEHESIILNEEISLYDTLREINKTSSILMLDKNLTTEQIIEGVQRIIDATGPFADILPAGELLVNPQENQGEVY